MRRVVAWTCSLFDYSWISFLQYLVLIDGCIAGFAHASYVWIIFIAGTLSLLRPAGWSEVIKRAAEIDAEWRELARTVWPKDALRAVGYFARGLYLVPLVIGAQ